MYGASIEGGMQGLLNEMTMFNAIPEDCKEVLCHMDELGGPTTFNHVLGLQHQALPQASSLSPAWW
jgi:hypothetical protein